MTMYKTNVFGVVNVTNAFLPYMRRQRSGTVVIIGSRSGWSNRFPVCTLSGSVHIQMICACRRAVSNFVHY